MGADTTISWCDYTYNPWIGCTKVSAGCRECYASTDTAARVSASRGLPLWGPGSTRQITKTARDVRAWNRRHKQYRETESCNDEPYRRPRVFCASLADVFESPEYEPAKRLLADARPRLWSLIEECTELDWLLLTKRPENVRGMVPVPWMGSVGVMNKPGWPSHVWLGTSVEDQAAADARIPHLLAVPASVRFLSCEPLLGPVNLSRWMTLRSDGRPLCCECCFGDHCDEPRHFARRNCPHCKGSGIRPASLHWVIVGGESGPRARPMHPDWVRGIRDQCQAAGAAYHFKQWGEWAPSTVNARRNVFMHVDGRLVDDPPPFDCDWWRERHVAPMGQFGKKAAGRELDGLTWDELPEVQR